MSSTLASGMPFFSPANVMRLLEVVRGAATAPDVLVTLMELAPRIGKLPVVSGNARLLAVGVSPSGGLL